MFPPDDHRPTAEHLPPHPGTEVQGQPPASRPVEPEQAVEVPGYRLDGELARGGMGVVYRALDLRLNRSVAVKVLQERFAGSPLAAARFLEEAQITAQLQHPGIPPVHQVGTLADGRPFLAMKLVKGKTLAALLGDTGWDRGQVAGVFEQVCQAVAYAHGHGVIHRDLKPANVMVGAFGEVQVMDWGLAKVRTGSGSQVADAGPTLTAVRDPRGSTDELATNVGTALGTPAYMAPEQAIGAVEQIDERSDVFGLGGILCEALTGTPPYAAGDAESTRRLAAQAKLGDAHARLAACNADPELVALCKRCLSPEPADRPAGAGAVAMAMAALRAAAAERARTADLDRARAEGDLRAAAEAAKRRRLRLVLAAATALFVGIAGAGVWWQRTVNRERTARDVDAVEAALGQAEAALRADDAALAAARLEEAERRLGPGGPPALRERFERDRAECTMLEELDRIDDFRWTWSANRIGWQEAPKEWPPAFQQYGVDLARGDQADAARRVADSPILDRLLSALHRWLAWRPEPGLLNLLQQLDADPFRSAMRDAMAAGDLGRVRALAERPDVLHQPVWFALMIDGGQFIPTRRLEEVLLAAHRQQPNNFWLLMSLGNLELITGAEVARERMGWYQAAIAVRPRSAMAWHNYGVARYRAGEFDQAIGAYLESIRHNPAFPSAHTNLAMAVDRKGDPTAAIATFREAVRLAPANPRAVNNLTAALRNAGDPAGGIPYAREAVRLAPTDPTAHVALGESLQSADDWAGAVVVYREALGLAPDDPDVHHHLGNALARVGDRTAALVAYREAVRLGSTDDTLYSDLARALRADDDPGGAVEALREAVRLGPDYRDQYQSLAEELEKAGDLTGLLASCRWAVAKDPTDASRQRNLAEALLDAGESEAALAAVREAIRLDPRDASYHYVLGLVLADVGDRPGTAAAYREAIRLDPRDPDSHNNLAHLLAAGPDRVRDGPAAVRHATRACELTKWSVADYLGTLAMAYAAAGDFDRAVEYQRKTLACPGITEQQAKEARERLLLFGRQKSYYDPSYFPPEVAPPPRVVNNP